MRFAEFNQLNEAAGTGYYTVGDSTAYNLAMSSDIWSSLAQIGATSSSGTHKAAIDKIPAGAVVAISVGADDLSKNIDSPEQVAANAASIVSYAKNKGLQPVFVLFPSNIGDPERNQQIKSALKSSIPTNMLDMDGPSGKTANYPSISSQIFTFFKPPASLVRQQPAAGQATQAAGGMVGAVSAYLKTKMDDTHRLGILANIKRESNFNPGAIGDGGTSGGLFQHHADRFAKMIRAAGGKGAWKTNWQAQVDFALSEPAGQQYLATKFRTPAEAVAWWVKHFEKPANQAAEIQKRISFLNDFDSTSAPATSKPTAVASAAVSGDVYEKLIPFTAPDKRGSGLHGLQPQFAQALLNMFTSAPPAIGKQLQIFSGHRTEKRQKELWAGALRKYGSVAAARRWVAPPTGVAGSVGSHHNWGVAADLKYGSAAAKQWVHANCSKFGLTFRMSNEPWHIEPADKTLIASAKSQWLSNVA